MSYVMRSVWSNNFTHKILRLLRANQTQLIWFINEYLLYKFVCNRTIALIAMQFLFFMYCMHYFDDVDAFKLNRYKQNFEWNIVEYHCISNGLNKQANVILFLFELHICVLNINCTMTTKTKIKWMKNAVR